MECTKEEYISHQEIQDLLLNMLSIFDEYCQKHGFRYVLVWGTLLGAVRHEGFIPWDNDIDLAMPRADYQAFLELQQENPIADYLQLINWKNDENFHYSISRVVDTRYQGRVPYLKNQPKQMSIWLDIFPFDAVPQGDIVRPAKLRLWHALQGPMMYKYSEKSWKNLIKTQLGNIARRKRTYLLDRIDQISQNFYCSDSPERYACLAERNGPLTFIDADSFSNPEKVQFCGLTLPAMQNYENWLSEYYGDYLTLPPLEERVSHDIQVFRVC